MSMGSRIKQRRKDLHMTQSDLAERVGVERVTIARYETGVYQPAAKILPSLAKALNCTTDFLNGLDASPIPHIPTPSITKIPIFDHIPAGFSFSTGNTIGFLEIGSDTGDAAECFALRIHGANMEPCLTNNDIVIIRKASFAHNGQIVLIQINGFNAAIEKITYLEKGISLESLNRDYPSRFYTHQEIKALPVKVLGVVIELRRKLSTPI